MYRKIVVAGNLGGDPEMRHLPSGTTVTNFSVAANRQWTDNQGVLQKETVWFRVPAFGRQAEVCSQYLSKGRAVFIEGRLRPGESGGPRIWGGQYGQPRASLEAVMETVRFLGRRSDGNQVEERALPYREEEDEPPF